MYNTLIMILITARCWCSILNSGFTDVHLKINISFHWLNCVYVVSFHPFILIINIFVVLSYFRLGKFVFRKCYSSVLLFDWFLYWLIDWWMYVEPFSVWFCFCFFINTNYLFRLLYGVWCLNKTYLIQTLNSEWKCWITRTIPCNFRMLNVKFRWLNLKCYPCR